VAHKKKHAKKHVDDLVIMEGLLFIGVAGVLVAWKMLDSVTINPIPSIPSS
jgi:hypothetical protein